MTLFAAPEFHGHELVEFVHDPSSGLRAIIALHRCIPRAGGGIRMKAYACEDDALTDALRLSRAMSYKWAFAGIARSGGKTVIIGNPDCDKSPDLLRALGRSLNRLGGLYYAGPDSGTGPSDMRIIREVTPYVRGGNSGNADSGSATAYGVLQGMLAATKHIFDRDRLDGLTIAVQGAGSVGASLCAMLAARGAKLIVSDINPKAAARLQRTLGAHVVSPEEILLTKADILAPCALGGVIDERVAESLQSRIICGAANNPLSNDGVALLLHARERLFVPDYVVNSGGIINAIAEGPAYDRQRVWRRLERIYDECLDLFGRAERAGVTSLETANLISEQRMRDRLREPEGPSSAVLRDDAVEAEGGG